MKFKRLPLLSLIVICILLVFQSCATKRNLVYFSNLSDSTILKQEIIKIEPTTIEIGDALAIKVVTLNPDANILFNSGSLPMNSLLSNSTNISTMPSSLPDGYIVDENGEIDFPVIGKIKLVGLSKEAAQTLITNEITKTAKNPIVNVRILNFNVTVIGEVTHPGSFPVPNNKINVLQALGLAGDMTPYAVRENVLVIREKEGKRLMERLNLTDKSVFQSPFFNLQQNDIVYVQPENTLKAKQANPARFQLWSLLISSISTLAITIYYITHTN